MVEQRLDSKRAPILKSGLAESGLGYSMENYLDVKKFNEEQDRIDQVHRDSAKKLSLALKPGDIEFNKKWNALATRPLNIYKAATAITETLGEQLVGQNLKFKDTVLGVNASHSLTTAKNLLILENLEKQRKLVKKNNFPQDLFEEYARCMGFGVTGNLSIKIEGVSMLDIFQKSDLTPDNYYNCIVSCWLTKNELRHEKVLAGNTNGLTTLYPNTAKQQIQECTGQILGISNLTPEAISIILEYYSTLDDMKREVIEKTKEVVKKTDSLEQAVFDTVFDPTSPFFPALKEKFETYLGNKNPTVKILAFQKLGLKTKKRIIDGYRAAKKSSRQNPEQRLFYEEFADFIKKYYVEEAPQTSNLLTYDDAVMFIDEDEDHKDQAIPTFEDLKRIKMDILQKSSKTEYILNPTGIPWQGLMPPTAALVRFPKDFPNKTDIAFYYENLEGEKTEIVLRLNTKNGQEKFDWNFLESPDDTQMSDMGNAAFLSVRSTLTAIKKETEIEYREKIKLRTINTSTIFTENNGVKKTEKTEVWVPKEKEEKSKPQKLLSPLQEVLQSEMPPQKEKNGIKKQIVLSIDNGIAKQLSRFSFEIQDKIKKGIERFNEDGGGRFKPLGIKYKEKTVYELRVVDKYRVLVVEEDLNGNGIKNFRVIEIGKRSEIFKDPKTKFSHR